MKSFPNWSPDRLTQAAPADESGLKYRAERKTFQGADATAQHAQNFIRQVRIGT